MMGPPFKSLTKMRISGSKGWKGLGLNSKQKLLHSESSVD